MARQLNDQGLGVDDTSFKSAETAREDLRDLIDELRSKIKQRADEFDEAELERQLAAERSQMDEAERRYFEELTAKHTREGKLPSEWGQSDDE